MEPIDWTPDGTGVAERPGWLGAGLTVTLAAVVVVVATLAGSEEDRGLLSDRSTGSIWSSAADC